MTIENELKELIIKNYGTAANFAEKIGINTSTLSTILKRGINNASINNIIKNSRFCFKY